MNFKEYLNEVANNTSKEFTIFLKGFDAGKKNKHVNDIGISNANMPYSNAGKLFGKKFPKLNPEKAFERYVKISKRNIIKPLLEKILGDIGVKKYKIVEDNKQLFSVKIDEMVDLKNLKLKDWVKVGSDVDNNNILYVVNFDNKNEEFITLEFYHEDDVTIVTIFDALK